MELDLANDLPPILCLHHEVGQVFLNLLINATHAIKERLESDPNSPKGKITLATSCSEKEITVTISDNGNGISKEIIDKVFDPFFTTKDVGKGTGQGLAIARDVIQNKHDGEITVISLPGEGTTFTLHLPR